MIASVNIEEAFLDNLSELFEKSQSNDTFISERQRTWDQFLSLGLPTQKNELYQYVRLRKLYNNTYITAKKVDIKKKSLAPYILEGSENSLLVFVNGNIDWELSDITSINEKLIISTFKDAEKKYGAFIKNQYENEIEEEKDPFALLNSSLQYGGVFLYLPPKREIKNNLQIINLVTENYCLSTPRVHLVLGSHSSLNLVQTTLSFGCDSYLNNSLIHAQLEEKARLKIIGLSLAKGTVFDFYRVNLKKKAYFESIDLSSNPDLYRKDHKVYLLGEYAEAHLYGAWHLKEASHLHTHILMKHSAPFCTSTQHYKGVLYDESMSSFEGLVYVDSIAQKTDAYQLNNNLVLDNRAKAYSKPNLEIFADDVKASHGATVGKLDKELLFYLRARGIPEKDAECLLVSAFKEEIINKINDKQLKREIIGLINGRN